MSEPENPLRQLQLPRRWELLAQSAAAAEFDPAEIVERVDDAAERVDQLLRRVRSGGGGVIEVFYGLSGSGRTTFLQTLSRFFDGVRISIFPRDVNIKKISKFVEDDCNPHDSRNRIILIDRRDNPTSEDLSNVEEAFGEILNNFREPSGAVVILWPITKTDSATRVAQTAWEVGRDSMADAKYNGRFHFRGIDKSRYWDVADNTSRTLTGDGLEAFGITPDISIDILSKCDTISDYFNEITLKADDQRSQTWSILKVRVITHLWVVLPGDDLKQINATADALTQGTKSKIDIDKIGELIDRPDQDAIYVSEWKTRRGKLAHLLRVIDVRLVGLPPNVSLAAIRMFGDDSLKKLLKQPAANLDASKSAMKASRIYKSILVQAGVETSPFAGARQISKETIEEFLRIQGVASKNDKPLNKALGTLIAECLADDAPNLKVVSEKKSLPGSSLQPDIQIELRPGEYICIEPTWRTSGVGIENEVPTAQNTLTEAHLKKYLLDKATTYVEDLGL